MMELAQLEQISMAMLRQCGARDRGFDITNALQRSWSSLAVCSLELSISPGGAMIHEIVAFGAEVSLLHNVFAHDCTEEAREIRRLRMQLKCLTRNAKKCGNLTRKKTGTGNR
jgi:hypothetical protein